MKREKDKNKFTKFGLLVCFLKGSTLIFVAAIVAGLIVNLFSTIIPQIISFTIDSVIGDEQPTGISAAIAGIFGGTAALKQAFWLLAAALVVLAVFHSVSRYLQQFLNSYANQKMTKRMRTMLFTHIQRLPMSWHFKHNTGDIIQRCTTDTQAITDFISDQLLSLVRVVILITLSLVFMFMMNVQLALVAAAFIPVVLISSVVYRKIAHKTYRKCDEEEGVLSTYAQENLTGVRVVKAFGRERYEVDKFEKQNVYYTSQWVKIGRFMSLYFCFSDVVTCLQLLTIIAVGCVLCINGSLTSGNLVAFISYNTMLMGPVRVLGRVISNLSRTNVALERIAEIMNADEENYDALEFFDGDIVFDNVSFSYGDGKHVLKNINLTIPKGTTLGIIGGTGSGKSTLAALLGGLYPVEEGKIIIGGRDISTLSPYTIRRNVGHVLQEAYLFSGTVGSNIAVTEDGLDCEDIRRAARMACIDGDIGGFANGYETLVGERGVTLSGGQKQRVSIARTLLRGCPIMIFDDSLSAVDSDTDARIRANLAALDKRATNIIISHRITTIMRADNIIVMSDGEISESGTSAELFERGGIYRRLYDMQMSVPDELKEQVGYGK